MHTTEYLLLFWRNPYTNLFLFIVGLVIFWPLFKKYTKGIMDPFFYILVTTVIAYVVPFFLYMKGECPTKHFIYFILSESLFWLVFYLSSKNRVKFKHSDVVYDHYYSKKIFEIAILIFVLSSSYIYLDVGIPLFMASRLDIFKETASGVGILGRLKPFAQSYVIFYGLYQVVINKNKKYLILFALVIIDFLLSGAKGEILKLVWWYFIFSYYIKGVVPKLKLKYLFIIISFPIVVILYSAASEKMEINQAISVFFLRIISYGDGYWMAYPDNTIDYVKYKNPLIQIFGGFLGMFRLISYSEMQQSLGIQLHMLVDELAAKYGTSTGPNARLSLIGWVCFKWNGLIFSAAMGWLMSFFIYRIRRHIKKNFLGIFIYGSICLSMFSLISDPFIAFDNLGSLILNFLIYYLILFIITNGKISLKSIL